MKLLTLLRLVRPGVAEKEAEVVSVAGPVVVGCKLKGHVHGVVGRAANTPWASVCSRTS